MQKFSTWMILSLAVVFWILRVIATYTYSMAIDFMIKPIDLTMEIILLFVALLCFVLIAKRKLLGVILYCISYLGYFGMDILNFLTNSENSTSDPISLLFSFVGIVLPIFALFDWLLDKNKQAHPKDKKTDWFYTNEQFDRKLDDRADKNNYKTL